jgi:hypothetical protein
MQFGRQISMPEISALGLGAMEADLGASDLRRDVKIYKVPQSVSDDQYYISATEAGGIEEVPPSRSRDNILLVRYTLAADGDVSVQFIHKEVQNAQN